MRRVIILSIIQFFVLSGLFAQGRIIIPHPPEQFPQKQIDLNRVNADIHIRGNVGTVTLEQVFSNPSQFRLEGEYLFAIPDEANVNKFYLYIDGKKTEGRVLDAKEAYQTYTNIVRSMRDPALLEFAGHGLFKARIFPIEPKSDRKIELIYDQMLRYESGTFRFTLPIRQSGQGSINQFHMTLDLQSDKELGNIYSPSHTIQVNRINKNKAQISFEQNNLEGEKDFILYYSLSDKEINADLFSFRPRTDQDGYFMFYAEPKYDAKPTQEIAKDFIFVIDVSGSMQGEKIQQARDALQFCLNGLDKNDRFGIISFSSGINQFQKTLSNAGQDELENAKYFINNLSANGGTNINEALLNALNIKSKDDERPTNIVFLTDGLPTEGEQDISRILQNLKSAQKDFIRIFSFGVGFDVNTFLLDKLSADSHGSANYVKPGEDIEKEVSSLFAKISSPVLTEPEIDFGDIQAYDVYPQTLPDVFKGQSITITGRYRNPGKTTITLKGKQGGKTRTFEYNFEFQRRESDNTFVDNIWANRKIAHLLTQIRFNGENNELIESIKSLGLEYGIVTPYTSYLVTEEQKELAQVQSEVLGGVAPSTVRRIKSQREARDMAAESDEESIGSVEFFSAVSSRAAAPSASSGKGAVLSSRIQKKLASANKSNNMLITMRRLKNKTFYLRNGIWTEVGLDSIEPEVKIDFLSSEYFNLLNENSQLNEILAIGENLKFRWNGKIYLVTNKKSE